MRGPGFDIALARDGYAWWYVDALSDDGRHALTLIAFIGSVFSPYYAAARRRAPTDPRDHVAVNVALYGDGPRRWTMTERGRAALAASADTLRIGPSALRWEGDALIVTLDEVAVPWPRRVRGSVRLEGLLAGIAPLTLDAAGHHRWQPIAPRARVAVALEAPRLRWSGEAYLDSNWGDTPLESSFTSWQWSRTPSPEGGCRVHYEVCQCDGLRRGWRLDIARDGEVTLGSGSGSGSGVGARPLARSRWGIERSAHEAARLRATLEDGPFYTRSLLDTPGMESSQPTFHESLSLTRFRQRWVQSLLPFRMPRRAGPRTP